jgi:hypothetical protein
VVQVSVGGLKASEGLIAPLREHLSWALTNDGVNTRHLSPFDAMIVTLGVNDIR